MTERSPGEGARERGEHPILLPHDVEAMKRTQRLLRPLRDHYFRAEVRGLDRAPDGPALYVGNHNGGVFPVDGIFFGMAWHDRFEYQRPVYWLMHDVPFRVHSILRDFLLRHGCIPASREHLAAAFDRGHGVVVYPGGARETFRPFSERKKVTLGDRTGFVAMALRHRVPIVPVVSVGAHETLIVLTAGRSVGERFFITKALRADVLPVYVGLPWGIAFGPMPHLPLPAKVTLEVLEPIDLAHELNVQSESDMRDPAVLRAGLVRVRSSMQSAMDLLYAERKWPVFG